MAMMYQLPEQDRITINSQETAIVAACLMDKNAVDIAVNSLDPRDIQGQALQEVYKAIVALYQRNEHVDIQSVQRVLTENKKLDLVGGILALLSITEHYITSVGLDKTIAYVQQQAVRSRLLKLAPYIADLAIKSSDDVDGAVQTAQNWMDKITTYKNDEILPASDVALEVANDILDSIGRGDDVTGVKTGYRDVDRLLGGLQEGEVLVVAGATGMGKTAFALNVAQNVAIKQGLPVAIVSLEMSKKQLTKRILCSLGGVSSVDTRYLSEAQKPVLAQKLAAATETLAKAPIYIIDKQDMTVNDLQTTLRRMQHQHGLGLVIVDYLQLMHGSPVAAKQGRVQEVTEISRNLKTMARNLNVPVMELSQLNRAVDATSDKRPTLAHIRDSGGVAQDADKIALLYRKDYYTIQNGSNDTLTHTLDVIIAKNRDGDAGIAHLYYHGATTTLKSLAKDDVPSSFKKQDN